MSKVILRCLVLYFCNNVKRHRLKCLLHHHGGVLPGHGLQVTHHVIHGAMDQVQHPLDLAGGEGWTQTLPEISPLCSIGLGQISKLLICWFKVVR